MLSQSATANPSNGGSPNAQKTTADGQLDLSTFMAQFAMTPSDAQNGQLSLFTDGQFSQLMEFMNSSVFDLMATFNKLGEGALIQYSRTNDVLEKLVDPKKMFILSAATAAGAAIGGGVAKIGLDLAVKGIKEAYDRISGNHHKRWVREHSQEFTQAREAYEKLENSATELDRNFSMIAKMLELSTVLGFNLNDAAKLRAQISPEIEMVHQAYLNTTRDLGLAYDAKDAAKQEALSKEAARLRQTEMSLQTIIATLGQINQFCPNAEAAFQRADEIQGTLQDIRAAMFANENAWLEHDSNNFFKTIVKDFRGASSAHHLRVLERLGRKHVRRSERTSDRNIDLAGRDKVTEACNSLASMYRLVGKEYNGSYEHTCSESIFDTHSDLEIAALFQNAGSNFVNALAASELTKKIEDVRKMEASEQANIDQNQAAIDQYIAASKDMKGNLLPSVGIENAKFNSMLMFLTHLKTAQVKAYSKNFLENRAHIRSFCATGVY